LQSDRDAPRRFKGFGKSSIFHSQSNMPHYKERNYHSHWKTVKTIANLDESLFEDELSSKLAEQDKLFKRMMRASADTFDELYQAHGEKAFEIQNIVKKYRDTVNANGADADALKVLDRIDGSEAGCMIWDMLLDKNEKYKSMHES